MRARFHSYAAVIAAILLTAQAANASNIRPKVLVSIPPLVGYVEAIVTGNGDVASLVKPGQEPHHFALSPSQVQALETADILITPDLGMNPLIVTLAKKYPKLRVIELSKLEGASPLPYATENPWLSAIKSEDSAAEDSHTHATKANDPHLWLDPERMAAIALPLAREINMLSPTLAADRETNANALAHHLREEAIPAMRQMLAQKRSSAIETSKPEIPFITYHAAYQYFLARFGLTNHGEITAMPDEYLGAKTLETRLKAAGTVRIRCIITETDSTLVKRIAGLSNATIVILSPEQNVGVDTPHAGWVKTDYDRLLYVTAKKFGECL